MAPQIIDLRQRDLLEWVRRLRSGEYPQGRMALCEVVGGTRAYCCLGVLGEQLDLLIQRADLGVWESSTGHAFLPDHVMDLELQQTLARLNDGPTWDDPGGTPRHTFGEIADWIEKNLIGFDAEQFAVAG